MPPHGLFLWFGVQERADMLGLDALRVYLPEAGFAELIGSLVTRCEHGQLSQTLESLRCLYGDL